MRASKASDSPEARLMSCDCLEVTEDLREMRDLEDWASLSMAAVWMCEDGWVVG